MNSSSTNKRKQKERKKERKKQQRNKERKTFFGGVGVGEKVNRLYKLTEVNSPYSIQEKAIVLMQCTLLLLNVFFFARSKPRAAYHQC